MNAKQYEVIKKDDYHGIPPSYSDAPYFLTEDGRAIWGFDKEPSSIQAALESASEVVSVEVM